MPRPRSARLAGLLAAGALLTVPLVGLAPASASAPGTASAVDCPAGSVLAAKTAGERRFERSTNPAFSDLLGSLDASTATAPVCTPIKRPESFAELRAMQTESGRLSAGPHGPPAAGRAACGPGRQGRHVPGCRDGAGSERHVHAAGQDPADRRQPGRARTSTGWAWPTRPAASTASPTTPSTAGCSPAPAPAASGCPPTTARAGAPSATRCPTSPSAPIGWSPDGPPGAGTLSCCPARPARGGNVYTGLGAFCSAPTSAPPGARSSGIPDGLMGFDDRGRPDATRRSSTPPPPRGCTAPPMRASATSTSPCRPVSAPASPATTTSARTPTGSPTSRSRQPGGVGADTDGGQVARRRRLPRRPAALPGHRHPAVARERPLPLGHRRPRQLRDARRLRRRRDPVGFAPQERVGRTELGGATGPDQDHDFLYAVVEDAVLFNGGVIGIDVVDDTAAHRRRRQQHRPQRHLRLARLRRAAGSGWPTSSSCSSPVTESALIGVAQSHGHVRPGRAVLVRHVDRARPVAASERRPDPALFGLEEVWETRLSGTAAGRADAVGRAGVLPGHRAVLRRRDLQLPGPGCRPARRSRPCTGDTHRPTPTSRRDLGPERRRRGPARRRQRRRDLQPGRCSDGE